ncbi:reverse transcriptase domain-containing protein [Tanacetum coccineum]
MRYAPWLCVQLELFMWYAPWLCVQLELFMCGIRLESGGLYSIKIQLKGVEIIPTDFVFPIEGEHHVWMLRLKEVLVKIVGMHWRFDRPNEVERGRILEPHRLEPIFQPKMSQRMAHSHHDALEKLILALVHAARRLRSYFQAHPIIVLTDAPINQTIMSLKKSGQIAKWAIKLGEHDIEFRERGSVQKHIPKDFSIEMPSEEGKKIMARKMETKKEKPKLNDT